VSGIEDLPDLACCVTSKAWEGPGDEPSLASRHRDRFGDLGGRDSGIRYHRSDVLAARKVAPGALRDSYRIPEVTFSRRDGRVLLLTTMLIAGWVSWHLGYQSLVLLACTAPATTFRALSYVLSLFDKPVEATPAGQERLDRLHVTIAVPVFNEDPGLLDRCIFAMVNQSRPAQLIWVVDDGSMTDYSALARHWVGSWPNGTEVRWSRQHNQGKRRAHARVFESVPEADVFVTVDSDTTLERRALEEGLKPLQSRRVMSVAGIEMGFNANVNLLTRLQSSLQLYAQAVIGAAWSVAGDMYTNRGPFALYRAAMVREFLPVYRDETFFGRQVTLGDDSLLALCASERGRSVQQLSAFGLTMWPERLGHHLRQRLRWARGRAVRNFWRIRYRPVWSYCWWFTASGIHGFLLTGALLGLLMALWPVSANVVARAGLVLLIMSVPNSLRTLCFRRSDERWRDRLVLVLIRPLSALWSGLVLARIVRLLGTVTLLRQGWTTRKKGAEIVLGPEPGTAGVPVTAGSQTAATVPTSTATSGGAVA
jgi:hyaluronan synthase